MRFAAPTLLVVALAAVARPAHAAVTTRAPEDDVGIPFWCDWGYDWGERCYRDRGPRLPVGGVDDKVWRSAIRFSVAGIPAGAAIASARLYAYFDGVCVAPRLTATRCPSRTYVVQAHAILSADWYHEREVEFDGAVEDETSIDGTAAPQWLAWDVTALVRAWTADEAANDGILLSLADWQEDFETSGPYLPSMSSADPALRPRLVVAYTSPTGPAP